MASAWTTPLTWTAGMVPGETDFNTYIRDNMNALKDPPFQQIVTASAGDVIATASTAIPITGNLSITLTTHGGAIQFCFEGRISGGSNVVLNMDYNGTAFTTLASGFRRANNEYVVMQGFITGLPSGSHTFKPTWLQPAGNNMRLSFSSEPAIFWVREVS